MIGRKKRPYADVVLPIDSQMNLTLKYVTFVKLNISMTGVANFSIVNIIYVLMKYYTF